MGWIPTSATNVIFNWPEQFKTQPHDDRDKCFLPFDSTGPCGMTVNKDIDDDSATKHSNSHSTRKSRRGRSSRSRGRSRIDSICGRPDPEVKEDLVEGGRAEVQDQTAVVQEVPSERRQCPNRARRDRFECPSPIRRLSLRWTSAGLDPRGQQSPDRPAPPVTPLYPMWCPSRLRSRCICLHRELHQKAYANLV